ncbi:unnamed protein product [Allacma fusca]|uniref:Cyclic nucleotide-binding domain-containing protein n=1 Tax=Allacma fusca TaxID=39272 RepID=A0A8J2KJA2_9HEXA|nr:unnamed protein product [Allacma fusca]
MDKKETSEENEAKKQKIIKVEGANVRGKTADPINIPVIPKVIGEMTMIIMWETFICLNSFMFFLLITYEAFFAFEDKNIHYYCLCVDIIFLLDMLLRLSLEIYRYRRRTMCTFFFLPLSFEFWIMEIIAQAPLELIYVMLVDKDSIKALNYVSFFKMNRCLRILRIFRFLSLLDVERILSEFWVFVLKFFAVYLGFIQIVACILYYMTKVTPIDNILARNQELRKGTWMGAVDETKPGFVPKPWNHYMLTFSFSTSVVTTVGFGDLAPKNEPEMLFSIMVMLFGAIGLAGIFGSNMTTFLVERDGARYDLLYRVSFILRTLKRMNSSSLFAHKVKEYYDCLWNFREGVYHVQFINYLPPSMHEDILFDICTEMFDKAILFRGLEEPFLRAVSRVVEVVLYNPDMIICQQGDYAMTMYYIIQGECLVKSKHSNNVTTAILRAGCIFGESSLFFSFPYAVNVETSTCCQLLKLSKENLMDVFNEHIYILNFMRARIQERMAELRKFYEEVGEHPITWVQFRPEIELISERPYSDYPTELRWANGWNRVVYEDVVDDSEASIIVDMSCIDAQAEKDNTMTYRSCVVPPTLISPQKWVRIWHLFIIVITLMVCFLSPYNLVLRNTSEISYYTVKMKEVLQYPITIVYIVDVFVEITTALPVAGIHYKFKDGWNIKKKEFSFYLDIFAGIPFDVFSINNNSSIYVDIIITLSECLKLWKVIRYLHYLDDVYPENIFFFRLIHTTTMLIYSIHFLACFMFALACPIKSDRQECSLQSWLSSYLITELNNNGIVNDEYHPNTLADKFPYIISIYFSSETLSSAGFGDFSPQTSLEMSCIIVSQILGFYIIGYYTALLTSALSCTTRPTVYFQQKLVSIRQFLNLHGLSGKLRERIIEHYRLQHQYNVGVVLPPGINHLMYDSPPYLEEDVLYAEAEIHLEGIPIFTKVDPKFIIRMAKLMDRYILPPNIYFIRRGDVRRQMYVIYKGSLAVLKEDTNEVKAILEPTGHFGLRDLLLGEPSHNNIKTLSYCLIYGIDLQSYNEVFEKDDDLIERVEEVKAENADTINVLAQVYADLGKATQIKERKPTDIPSWVYFPTKELPHGEFCDYEEFMEPYDCKFGWLFRLVLMRRTIHPAGTFALAWNLVCGILCALFMITIIIQSGDLSTMSNEIIRLLVHIFLYMDMYLKMHWGYYTEGNHLVCHPVKTAIHYVLEGPLVYTSLCGLVPYDTVLIPLQCIGFSGYGEGLAWMTKLRWIGFLNIGRVPIILKFGRNVFTSRTLILLVLYVFITLAVCTIVSVWAFYIACPWDATAWKDANINMLPSCFAGTWVDKKDHLGPLSHYTARWITGVYYVCQTMLVIGFGDMITLREEEIYLLCFMMIFGFIFLRCIISDMTAAAVDSDEIRAGFLEQMKCLRTVLERENVHSKMVNNVIEHMNHTWLLSKGLQPQELLWDLHPALQSDLFSEYIGDAVSRVPIFSGVRDNILRTVCTKMRKLYFTRGERIMRRGNLEYEMFVIVDGDVWITERNMELKCTLGPGESMGETQMMYGFQRRFSAIAANNVEVFALNAKGFGEILDRYPSLKSNMEKRLLSDTHDLFERKIHFIETKRSNLEYQQDMVTFDNRVFRNSAILREIVYAREVVAFKEDDDESVVVTRNKFIDFFERYIFSYGPDDYDLPFIYFASPTVMKKFSFLLHPQCGFQNLFQNLVLGACLLSPALGTYQVCFATDRQHSRTYDVVYLATWILEGIMIFHIFLQFITPFGTVEGKYCKQFKRISFRYVVSPTRFAFDLVAALPVHLYVPVNLDTEWKFLNLIRVLRLNRYYRTQSGTKDSISVTTFRYNLSISVPFFFTMAHLLACVFYYISSCDSIQRSCRQGTWTNTFVNNFLDGDNSDAHTFHKWKWYVRSLYWVVATISTTGFGDITAESLAELIIAIICVFCGAFLLSIILSQFVSGITSRTKFHREFLYQVKLLAAYLRNIGLNPEHEGQLQTWFLFLWDTCRGTSYKATTEVLPLCLQIDVNLAIFHDVLVQVPLFVGLDKRFLRQVSNRVMHTVYLAGLNVVNEGDTGHTLYIVSKGRIAGSVVSRTGKQKLIRWYEPGKCFGKLPALFYDQTYSKTYRAEETTEILYIHQKDIFHLAQRFPEFAVNLQQHIRNTYNPELGMETIFTRHLEIKRGLMDNNRKLTRADRASTENPDNLVDKSTSARSLLHGNTKNGGKKPKKHKMPKKGKRITKDKFTDEKLSQLLEAHAKLRLGEYEDHQDDDSDIESEMFVPNPTRNSNPWPSKSFKTPKLTPTQLKSKRTVFLPPKFAIVKK